MAPLTFLITGTSTGFGNHYVSICLQHGHNVIATARDISTLSFPHANQSNLLLARLDVTDKATIDQTFDAGVRKFGRIDVVCNNAGYGLGGEFESLTDHQIRSQFDINFFGLMDVTRKAMQTMRSQSPPGGIIQQVTSIGGQVGYPLFSIYGATKWAVEGFTESISKEVKPSWNIKFTIIEPGGFRTDWAGRSMQFGTPNPAYDHLNVRQRMNARHGTQPGDPKKGANVFYQLAVMQNPPLRCAVGTDCYAELEKKMQTFGHNLLKYKDLSLSTDVDGYASP